MTQKWVMTPLIRILKPTPLPINRKRRRYQKSPCLHKKIREKKKGEGKIP
jgi:hypothetical protein